MAENAFYARQAPNAGAREKSASLKRSYDKFLAVFPDLLEKHHGEYVAIHDGKILGIESNENILVQLPRDKNMPLFIARIEPPREVPLEATKGERADFELSEEKLAELTRDLAVHCTNRDLAATRDNQRDLFTRYFALLQTPEGRTKVKELWHKLQERQARRSSIEQQLISATKSGDGMAVISATIAYIIELG